MREASDFADAYDAEASIFGRLVPEAVRWRHR